MERRKPGRPSKGVRVDMKVRVPPTLRDAFQAEAEKRGMTVNDLAGEMFAQLTGTPYSRQEALPLSNA